MAAVEPSSRGTKRRARESSRVKMVLNVDLNSPPIEGTVVDETSSSVVPPTTRGSAAHGRRSGHRQGSNQSSDQGSNVSLIDIEETDDEVQVLSSSRGFPQRRNHSRRNQPVMVVLDEDLEIRSSGDVEGPVTTLSLNTHSKPNRSYMNKSTINCEVYPDTEEKDSKGKAVATSLPEPVKEPTFTCPVCMNPLVEASSTICGHVFCQACIKASIQAQKKCPTCRRKLTMSNFHRVYLPTTD